MRAGGRQHLLAAATAGLLVAAAILVTPTAEAAPTRAFTITTASAGPVVPFKAFDGNPPKAFDIDGDGRKEIFAQNDNQYLYVFDSSNGALLAQLLSTFPAGWGARTFNGPEAYSEGGVTRIVQVNSAAYVTSWRYDPGSSTSSKFSFVKEWERRATDCHPNPSSDSKATLADLDGDGKMEIIVTTEESGIVALRGNGAVYWTKCIGGGNAEATVGDLNQDGWPDVVFGSDGGLVTAMNGRTGATMWTFNAKTRFTVGAASIPVGVAIGQVDGLGGPDVVFGVRDSHDPDDWSKNHAMLVALNSNGALLWARQDSNGGNPLTYTRPIIVDADGDGKNEIYWGDWNTNGHKPPFDEAEAWRVTGPGNFYRYDGAGNLVWKQSLATYWSNKDLALGDIDGDGVQEILANGPNGGHDGIWALDSRTGAKESFIDAYPWMAMRGPILADLRGDGGMQMVLQVGPQATTAGAGIQVYNTGVPFNAKWPHLPENQPGSPPPVSGSFGATFTIKSPNAWWQEVSIQPDTARTIASVQVRFTGHDWQPMAKSSWGAWTSSYHTPAGSTVEFLATDTGNFVSQSAPFTWMDGTLSKRSISGGTTTSTTTTGTATTTTTATTGTTTTTTTSGGFQATFQVPSGVNEWWVEAAVQANAPLAKVETRIGNGEWTALSPTTWGTWAKSFHCPAGSQVTFRATSNTGATATSQAFTWMSGGSGTTTSSSTSSSPTSSSSSSSSAFQASFSPQAVGNDWWVEVAVTANQPLANVEASRNGGAWVALDKTSWGTWAKSVHAPDGTTVVFRATSTTGGVATSPPVVWT